MSANGHIATLPIEAAVLAEAHAPVVRYRLATDADGPAIGALFAAAEYQDHGVDWTRPNIAPYWWVAERDGAIVGAVQVVISQPFGYVGELVVHPDARGHPEDGRGGDVTTQLCLDAMRLLAGARVQIMMGFVNDELVSWQRALQEYGGVRVGGENNTFGLFAWRLS